MGLRRCFGSRLSGAAARGIAFALGAGRCESGAVAASLGGCGGVRCGRGGLGRPVVDVPVVFVEEAVVGVELGPGHVCEVGVGEGGEEEVTF